jgi:hypothetical protein
MNETDRFRREQGGAMLVVVKKPVRPGKAGSPPAELPAAGAPRPPLWSAVIVGEPVAAGHAGEAAIVRGLPRVVRSRCARAWQSAALAQLRGRRPVRPFAGELALACRVWSSAPLVGDDALIGELLERAGIVAAFAQIRERHLWHGIDGARPRLEMSLARAQAVPFDVPEILADKRAQ